MDWRKLDPADKSTWPPSGDLVIVYGRPEGMEPAVAAATVYSYQGSEPDFMAMDDDRIYDVTHWMPLPPPPK